MKRREFSKILGAASAAAVLAPSFAMGSLGAEKRKVVLVGTGIRGNSFWGKQIIDAFPDLVEFVGLCDINESRLKYAQKYIGVNCPLYSNFDKMLDETKPDLVMVTTVDATHDEFIIKSLKRNIDVLTEKPMTTDEYKCDAIMKAERASKAKIIVGFNYRWSPYMTKIKELLAANTIGKITSVDFHWY
jgi:predicted dehydrogenase